MKTEIQKYILLGLFVLVIVSAVVHYNLTQSMQENIDNVENKLVVVENVLYKKSQFSYKKTKEIIALPKFKRYVRVKKIKTGLNITFTARLPIANKFVKKLGNSNAIIGKMKIKQLTNMKIQIKFKVKK